MVLNIDFINALTEIDSFKVDIYLMSHNTYS